MNQLSEQTYVGRFVSSGGVVRYNPVGAEAAQLPVLRLNAHDFRPYVYRGFGLVFLHYEEVGPESAIVVAP